MKIRLECMDDCHPLSSVSPSAVEPQLSCLDCVILPDLKKDDFNAYTQYTEKSEVLKQVTGPAVAAMCRSL